MSIGKYSPTVSASYANDRDWWTKNGGGYDNGIDPTSYGDDQGYDSYGYHMVTELDRAEYSEDEYLSGSTDIDGYFIGHLSYEMIADAWRNIII
jgi:hypothetical protein